MSRSIYALLVAIDDYPRPIPKLRGCVNDIDAFASYLNERVAKDKGVAIELKTLKNAEATRQAVIDAFRGHLGQAKKGDVALFYYSGHGSQEQAPEEFWTLEPDRRDETLVLFDSRSPGSWDLADKEIAKLIGDVAAEGAACRRDPRLLPLGLGHARCRDRCAPGSDWTRVAGRSSHSSFPWPRPQTASASRGVDAKGSSRYASPAGRHVLFAACRDEEVAKEYTADGKRHGAFSFFLGASLKSAAGVPTYRDLFARTSASVSSVVGTQSPQLEATRNEDLDATFLDGAIQPAPATFTASYRQGHWVLKRRRNQRNPRALRI